MNTENRSGARLRYGLLWATGIAAMIAGISLLIVGWTTIWVPDPTDTASWIPQPMSLAGPGIGLLASGAILVIVLLILDAYVAPIHRRRPTTQDVADEVGAPATHIE